MIGVIFQFGNEIVEVRIGQTECLFRTKQSHGALYPLEALRLDKVGVFKEHPDLKGNSEWKKEAIKRFKDKLKTYETEEQKMKYVIDDLGKFGYKPLKFQKKGHRPINIK